MSLLARLRTRSSASSPSPSPSQTLRKTLLRRQRILRRLSPHLPLFRNVLLLAGVVYTLLLLPSGLVARRHHVSENALQPGQANTYWNWADVHVADNYAADVDKWSADGVHRQERTAAIRDAFAKLGLPVARQEYTFQRSNSTLKGANVYAIYRAPKTDGAEALVLSASWLSRGLDDKGDRVVNARGVSIVLALANYLKKSSHWSKDIIFLISDGYSDGAIAWLDSYHGYGQANLQAEQLTLTTGPIWAALNVDYPYHSFSHVGLFFDGANGHLPNLDFVNSVSHILKHSGIPPILHGDVSLAEPCPTIFASLLPAPLGPLLDSDDARKCMRAAKHLWRQLSAGASGLPSGPEGVFGRYRIDALTMYAVPAEGPHGFHVLGRAIESTFRSLNNLLERFHASFFLYIMTSVETFVTVGNYLAAPILISASLTVTALMEWFGHGRSGSSSSSSKKTRSDTSSRPILTTLMLAGATHAVGVAMFAAIAGIDTTRPLWSQSPGTLSLGIVVTPLVLSVLFAPSNPTARYALASTLRAIALMSAGMTIAVVATLNFGLAVFASILLPLPLLLPRRPPFKNATMFTSNGPAWTMLPLPQIQQLAIAACSPPVLWSIVRCVAGPGRGLVNVVDRFALDVIEDWQVAGSASLPFALCMVVPLLLQSATAVLL